MIRFSRLSRINMKMFGIVSGFCSERRMVVEIKTQNGREMD